MKNQSVLFFVIAVVFMITGCHLKAKKAKIYHDNILQSVQDVIDASLDYGDAIQSHDKNRAATGYTHYSQLVNNAITKIRTTGDFEGDTSFQHYSLEMLGFYKTSLEQNFRPLLDSLQQEGFSEKEGQKADSLYSAMTMMESQYWERFNWAERKFSKQYEIEKVEK